MPGPTGAVPGHCAPPPEPIEVRPPPIPPRRAPGRSAAARISPTTRGPLQEYRTRTPGAARLRSVSDLERTGLSRRWQDFHTSPVTSSHISGSDRGCFPAETGLVWFGSEARMPPPARARGLPQIFGHRSWLGKKRRRWDESLTRVRPRHPISCPGTLHLHPHCRSRAPGHLLYGLLRRANSALPPGQPPPPRRFGARFHRRGHPPAPSPGPCAPS